MMHLKLDSSFPTVSFYPLPIFLNFYAWPSRRAVIEESQGRQARTGPAALAQLSLALQYGLGADKRRSAPRFPIKLGVILEFGDFADSEVERPKCARRILRPTVPGRTDLCARRHL